MEENVVGGEEVVQRRIELAHAENERRVCENGGRTLAVECMLLRKETLHDEGQSRTSVVNVDVGEACTNRPVFRLIVF